MPKKQAELLKALTNYLGVTQGEVVGLLLDRARMELPKTVKELKEIVESERTNRLQTFMKEGKNGA